MTRSIGGHSAALLILMLATHGSSNATGTTAIRTGTVNAVIGDRSFIERFGRAPRADDPEKLRMQTHLEYVERLLRSRDTSGLPAELRAERLRNLDRLRVYRLLGITPHNYDYPGEQRPCFIDRDGSICAVGYLVEQSAGREAAEAINRAHRDDFIRDMRSPILTAWIEKSGLTLEEAATIQPVYEYTRPTRFVGVSGGVTAALHRGMDVPERLRGDVDPMGLCMGLNPSASIHALWYLGQRPSWQNGIMLHIGYDGRDFIAEGTARDLVFTDANGEPVTKEAYYGIETEYRLLTARMMVTQRIGDSRLSAMVGPSIGLCLSSNRWDEHLLAAGWILCRQRTPSTPYAPLRLGVTAGVQYELTPRFASIAIVPSVMYDFALTDVRRDDTWRTDALEIGIELRVPVND